MYEVTIRKSFAAAHLLREIGGKCEELHGHNFIVEISAAAAKLNEDGLLIDFRLLKRWTDEVLEELDHKYLNDLPFFKDMNPSSEQIARFLYERIGEKAKPAKTPLSRVTVWESENARVSYSL
ncbi:MAG: 6-carboxytetrahydropterin synthase QueD [Proteobacteria bacterium]|nr:6-carboxytetrahydropterin synthase QueD [Pseudomonadota bacterium]MBU1743952.1 6-carboxytetrahydropterin synthase QueD [Pseudomonadota bacterium]MBU1966277.1 6-carboxytetrahydropterin synthase QueD [Pseudomonadota bacterium]